MYSIPPNAYKTMLTNNITKKYKKTTEESVNAVNSEAKVIVKPWKVEDRLKQYSTNEAFITLKDHKDDFVSNPKCRLINPAKSVVDLVNKKMWDNINNAIRKKSCLIGWQETQSVISWFNDISNKKKCKFIKFDIVEFCPSISKNLLLEAIEFAKSLTYVPQSVIDVILHCRKSFLFESGNIWIKKDEPEFDVAMGSYDGAEICELVGLYVLHLLEKEFGSDCFGLYRDDGLGYLKNLTGPKSEKCRKKLIKIFNKCDLKITSNTNLSRTDFLDST